MDRVSDFRCCSARVISEGGLEVQNMRRSESIQIKFLSIVQDKDRMMELGHGTCTFGHWVTAGKGIV